MGLVHDTLPLFARHEGVWEGEYIHEDTAGNELDRHASRIEVHFTDDLVAPYQQTNTYTWADGRTQVIDFPATVRDGRVHFDTDRILGHAWEADDRTIILTWHYKSDPQHYLYEMIQIDASGQHRARVWHWFDNGELVRRTLVKERRA
jgi:hypothetical protein